MGKITSIEDLMSQIPESATEIRRALATTAGQPAAARGKALASAIMVDVVDGRISPARANRITAWLGKVIEAAPISTWRKK